MSDEKNNGAGATRALPPFLVEQPTTTTVTLSEALQLQRRAYMQALMLERAAEVVFNEFGADESRGPPRLLVDLGAQHGLTSIPSREVLDLSIRLRAMADDQRRRARRILTTARVDVDLRDVVEPLPPGPAIGNLEQHEPVTNPGWVEQREALRRDNPQRLGNK